MILRAKHSCGVARVQVPESATVGSVKEMVRRVFAFPRAAGAHCEVRHVQIARHLASTLGTMVIHDFTRRFARQRSRGNGTRVRARGRRIPDPFASPSMAPRWRMTCRQWQTLD